MQKLNYVEKPHLKIIFFDKGYITQERGGFKKLKNSAEMCTRGEELQFTFTIYSEGEGGEVQSNNCIFVIVYLNTNTSPSPL